MAYATVDDVTAQLRPQTFTAAHNRQILAGLRTITRRIMQVAGMDFEPYYELRRKTAWPEQVNSELGIYTLKDYLLELDTIVNDGETLVYNTNVFAYPRQNELPITALRLQFDSDLAWYPCDSDDQFETIQITGWWGWKRYYEVDGFIDSTDDVPAGGITAAAPSFTVADVDGLNALGISPRISMGNLLRIEDELLEVVLTDTTTNAVTVRRGVRGTTAAAHAAGTQINVWNVEDDIRYVAARAAAYNFSRIGAFNTVQVQDYTSVVYPPDFPAQVRAAIQGYANG